MRIKIIEHDFSICKATDYSQIDWTQEYLFIGKTDEEHSLVCPSDCVPANVTERDDNWRAFRVQGSLDFSLIGILARISSLLAENDISIFAVSTFNTDYILVKKEKFDRAVEILSRNGYEITSEEN